MAHYAVTPISFPGGYSSYASAINGKGEVVGQASTVGRDTAFLYSAGKIVDLGSLGNQDHYSDARDINDRGDVVGCFSPTDQGPIHAFLYSGGTMIDLGSLGGRSEAVAINGQGQVVGYYETTNIIGSVQQAFIYESGQMSRIPIGQIPGPGIDFSANVTALDINDSGDVIAYGGDGSSYLYNSKQKIVTPFAIPGCQDFQPISINNSRQIFGIGYEPSFIDQYGNQQYTTTGIIFDLAQGKTTAIGMMGDLLPIYPGWRGSINSNGDVVVQGYGPQPGYGQPFENYAGFVWNSVDGMQNLDDLVEGMVVLSSADDINDGGQIVATADGPSSPDIAVLLTPVSIRLFPELSAVIRIIAGVIQGGGGPTTRGPQPPWGPREGDILVGLGIAAIAGLIQDTAVSQEIRAAALNLVDKSAAALTSALKLMAPTLSAAAGTERSSIDRSGFVKRRIGRPLNRPAPKHRKR